MEFTGGCHCGNLRVHLRLTEPPTVAALRSCGCSFCRAHGTRTVSDPHGMFEVWADDWSLVQSYRFGSHTADYLVCRHCGVYIGAVCETPAGMRAVVNTNSLFERAMFTQNPAQADHDGEETAARLARRAANWTPAVLYR